MTRPIGLLVFTTLSAVCLPGCAQWNWLRDGGNPSGPPGRLTKAGGAKSDKSWPTAIEEMCHPLDPQKVPSILDVLPPSEVKPVASTESKAPVLPGPVLSGDDRPKLVEPPNLALPKPIPAGRPVQGPPLPPTATPVNIDNPTVETKPADAARKLEPIEVALRHIFEGREGDALVQLSLYKDPDREELFLRLLPFLANVSRSKLSDMSTLELNAILEQMRSIQGLVRARTELVIDKACFCESVKSFGNYQPLPEAHAFLASAPNRPGERVQLYVELRNFANVHRGNFYETRFASTVEIHDGKGDKIWFYRFADQGKPIQTRTAVQDCFNHYSFSVPHLPTGTYTLTIHIADESIPDRRREARKVLEFRVGAGVR